ncbi:putative plus-end-directed kinesin ATPase [Rosa chinensis]|uniref:Putative plus-end-directed kinesin ATPase n=1 Tax=Rosa chinensis TaxID=74649 RepID=A0A2P6RA92_ROSCH|nr:putative plus-end-directed kinesin ATPase [Rosa chinensis]
MTSVTPDSRKVGTGMAASPSPFLTPRPEKRRGTLDWNSNHKDKDKEVNVQVVLRCRPLSDEEQKSHVQKVVSCNETKREVTVLHSLNNKPIDKVFTFDKVFGPKAQQKSIYEQAISPIVNEVLDGFNCTVFAYGQTGTGKTYTMEGGMRKKNGNLPAEAGVIPRAVHQIFDTLEAQNADYSLRVTFLELYNEEITDLLAPEDHSRTSEDRQKKPISLMEDGKGCVIVRGLEEEPVYTVNEIYTLLERGAAKRRTADTLLNKRSSRSHSVFSITVHIKEATVGDEELIKCGKLNLVDLAGSETYLVQVHARAREAGEINKSLLTLGRVINALVEHSTHIPYRDSKLTRLLRESLGGKTKTCIIATISPCFHFVDETLSTLDYAHRAKNIKNRPEANQKMSKTVLLKDLYIEIERMKEDIRAAREKNGVYIPRERFVLEEAEKKARVERIEQLENDLNLSEKQVEKFRELYLSEQEQKLDFQSELKDCKINLENSNKALLELQENHRVAILTLKEKEHIISKLLSSGKAVEILLRRLCLFLVICLLTISSVCLILETLVTNIYVLMKTENLIIGRAKELRTDLQTASEDISSLHEKLDQKDRMEEENQGLVLTFGSQLDRSLKDLHKTILGSVSQQKNQLRCMEEHVHSYLASKCDATKVLESRIKKISETYSSGVSALKELANVLQMKASSDLEQLNSKTLSQTVAVEKFLGSAVTEANEVIQDIQQSIVEHKQLLAFSTQQHELGLQRSLHSAQVISKASVNFFDDLHDRASEVMKILESSQVKRFHQLVNFEKMFKEEAAREEKQAFDKIAAVLETLTSKKISMVSEASTSIKHTDTKEHSILQKEVFTMQQVATDARKELSEHLEKVESHFMEDTFSAAESHTIMENCLQECSERVGYSRKQWENTESTINHMNKNSVSKIESTVKENISANRLAHEEFVSASSHVDADFDAITTDTLACVNASLMQDHEKAKEMDSITTLCLDQLKSVQDNHSESVSTIRNQAEKCLVQDYAVDKHAGTRKKKVIEVPSLASIEEMRSSFDIKEENVSDDKLKWSQTESKIPCPRTPFADVN